MLTVSEKLNLQAATQAAISAEIETGCPRELTVAQWALETGWGRNMPGNNCFGIKHYHGCYGIQMLPTVEYLNGKPTNVRAAFATFPSLEACFIRHAQLITDGLRYRAAWQQYLQDHDLEELIESISKAYATDPHYAEKLEAILAMPEVHECLM